MGTPPTGTEAGFRLRSIAVPAYGPTVVAAVGAGATLPVVALTALELGASPSVAALTAGAALVAELFFAVPAGAMVHRIGERRALLSAGAVDAVASLVALLAPNVVVLFAAVFAMGFTSSMFLVARQAYLIDAVPYSMRARAMSTLGGVNRIGLFVGPFVGAPVIAAWGAQAAFGVAVVSGLAASLLVWRAPDITAHHEEAQRAQAQTSTRRLLWAHRSTYATLGLGILVIGAARSARVVLVPLWAAHVGLSASATAVIFGVTGGIEMLLFYPAGSVMDRFGRFWVAVPCAVLLGAGALLLPLTHTAYTVLGASLLAAVGNGMGSGIVMTLGADNAPSVGRSQFLGGWRFMSVIGGSGAPLLISAVTARVGLAAACVGIGGLTLLGTGWLGYWVARFEPGRGEAGAR
ncbi:MFS transporter [Phycicoccus sp. 3266]|uniref:MFS transporter n=1 Tax=Phycicoccus sp. 3266 TaxID=2817751 RepID=UPI00285A0870|nr:MFS transporter [Phycicoccus sp. 3266]MDR6862749.1 MFS family permease [Phycicoccus sp. 3266]